MFPRRGPGLIRGVARTAVAAGTASAVAGNVNRHQQNRWAQQDAEQAQEAAPPAAQADSTDQTVEDLQKLAKLKEQGILTDEEFQAQKAKILGA